MAYAVRLPVLSAKGCILKLLVHRHANIVANVNKRDQTPLFSACPGLVSELAKHRIELIELLLDSGAVIESRMRVVEQHWSLVEDGHQPTRKFLQYRDANVKAWRKILNL